jgi:hypothetical protein
MGSNVLDTFVQRAEAGLLLVIYTGYALVRIIL